MEFEKLQEIIADVLNVDPNEVTMETTFADDLGADSLDVFQIVMGIEEEFDIQIEAEEAEHIVSVEDAQGAQLGHPQVIPQIREHLPRLDIESLPLFHKYANHICHCRLLISIVFSLIAANGSCHTLRL